MQKRESGYQRAFLERSSIHPQSNETEITENVIFPINSQGENNENSQTARLYSNMKRSQSSEEKKTLANMSVSSSEAFNHSICNLLPLKKSKYVNLQSKTLSAALREVPLSLQHGRLSLVGSYLTDIDILPEKLSDLVRTLYLSNNSLTTLRNVQQFKHLTTLSLANNSIRYLHALYPLSNLPFLEKVSLEGNVVTHMPYYRQFLIGICSAGNDQFMLRSIDSILLTREEIEKSQINFRTCSLQLEQMRCECLRVAVLEHMHFLFACHAELVRIVMGKFRNLIGSHIDINSSNHSVTFHSPDPFSCVASTLKCALSGGVFRWLQISGGRSFEMQAQDICYRMFLSSLRNIPPSRKTLILEQPAHLTAHWDMIMMESSSQFYKRIMLLIEKCEISSETVFTATRLSAGASKQPSENYRRSKDFDKASDFGLQKFSIEKENREPLIGAQAMTTLQSLQFVGGDLFHDPLTTAMNHSMTSPSTVFHELQQTYCGLGLHDRFLQKGKVLQNLNVFVEKPPKSHARNFETQVQEPETERSKSSAEQKYMNLLRNGGLALKKDTSENQKAESEPIIKKLNSKSHTEKRMASGFDESLPTERPNPSVLLKQHSELTGSASSKTTTTSKRDDSIKTSSEDQALIERNGESLFSSHLMALLDSSPSLKQLQRSEKIDHSTTSQWSTLFFTTSDLPLPELVSDYLLNSIQKNLKDPPAEIVGSPPLPLPQFPNHLQANMKSLTSIFDEHVRELETIDCDVGMLWTQRKNLNAGSEKVLSKLRLDMTMAASHLDQFVNKIDEAKCEVDQLRHWLPIVNFVDQGTTAQHHEKVKLSEQLDLILEESSRIFQGVKEQQFRKEEIASTTEEVIAAVSAMNDEISHSIEIQDILHSQSLALVLENHFEHAVPLRSLQKSVFNQFRSCIRRQQRLKNLRFRTMVKDSIRLLLLSWRKLQIFCRKKKNENKATRWIQHFRLGRWLAKWKVTFAKFRRIRNFDVERERRFLLRGLRLFRTNSLQSKMCTKVEKIRHKKSSLLKMRWVFRSWKFLVERKLWNHIDDETVLVSERKIIPLTVALRKREVQDQRYSTIAAHKRLQTLFFGWKKIVLLNRRVLKDKVMVLDSLLTQRRLKHGLWSWLNIFNSQLFHRGKVRRRFWSRWKRFKSTKVYLIHLRNKAEMAYRIKTLYSSLTSWMIFRGRQKRLRDAYMRLAKFQVLKLKLRALMGWKFAYSLKCEEKSKEELSMMFYLSRLRKGTWNMWRQWYLARKSATCIIGEHQQPQSDRLDKGNDDSDTESMESITMKTDWTRIFRTRKALYRWIKFARCSSRLRIAASLCLRKRQKSLLRSTFSNLMVVWLRCLQNRIVQGLSLADGSSEFEQRSTHVREKNISIQREIADIKAQVDECRSTLAEMQQKFDSLEGECFSIESELQIVQENFDTTQQEEKEQREVISGILLLCKGMSDSFSHESSHDSILSHHLSQKVGLLSELERCNESTLATSRYREREKIKICSGIQEGLEIGRQYKELLLGLSHEARILAEERRAGEICLEECRQRLEYSRQRVEGRVASDNQELSDLSVEKLELTRRYEEAVEVENLLREELLSLRNGAVLSDRQLLESSHSAKIVAALNQASCSSKAAHSEKLLADTETIAGASLTNFLEEYHERIPLPSGPPLHIVSQLQQMSHDANRRLYQTLSPTSFDISMESMNPDQDLNKRIQDVSQRIRERLKSPLS